MRASSAFAFAALLLVGSAIAEPPKSKMHKPAGTSASPKSAPPAEAFPAGNVARGGMLYESRCTGCHSLDANRVGPRHRGVVGRAAGSVSNYPYSAALKGSGLTWTEANLDRWLQGPIKFVPGVRMGFSVAEAADRRDIIAFLKAEGDKPPT